MIYYHGGFPGLKIGDKVLPPSKTGAASCSEYGASSVHDREKVYLTTNYQDALFYASMFPGRKAAVYVVEPDGDLEPDPDCNVPGVSFHCCSATVTKKEILKGKAKDRIVKMILTAM